ncbi:unnamed protein product, partial [Schistosoma mattheei]
LRTGGVITQLFDAIEFSVVHQRSTSYLRYIYTFKRMVLRKCPSRTNFNCSIISHQKSPNNFSRSQQYTSTDSFRTSNKDI